MIKIYHCPDTTQPGRPCKAKDIIKKMLDTGKLTKTLKAMQEKPISGKDQGNCHVVAVTFMSELISADMFRGWKWSQGYISLTKTDPIKRLHSWLEYDGWTVDASDISKAPDFQSKGKTILVMDTGLYYTALQIVKVLRQRDAEQTMEWISTFSPTILME